MVRVSGASAVVFGSNDCVGVGSVVSFIGVVEDVPVAQLPCLIQN